MTEIKAWDSVRRFWRILPNKLFSTGNKLETEKRRDYYFNPPSANMELEHLLKDDVGQSRCQWTKVETSRSGSVSNFLLPSASLSSLRLHWCTTFLSRDYIDEVHYLTYRRSHFLLPAPPPLSSPEATLLDLLMLLLLFTHPGTFPSPDPTTS